jgi:hypothetical protein
LTESRVTGNERKRSTKPVEKSVAAEASNEARRQVVTAIKQARTAWLQMKQELHQQVHDERDSHRNAQYKRAQQIKEAAQTK